MYTHTYMSFHVHVHLCSLCCHTCSSTHIPTHTHAHACTRMCAHACMHANTHTHTERVDIDSHSDMHTFSVTHTHTHTRVLLGPRQVRCWCCQKWVRCGVLWPLSLVIWTRVNTNWYAIGCLSGCQSWTAESTVVGLNPNACGGSGPNDTGSPPAWVSQSLTLGSSFLSVSSFAEFAFCCS